MEIEKTGPKIKSDQQVFIDTLLSLQPGESFLVDSMTYHWRSIITVLRYAMRRNLYTRKEKNKFRVGRYEDDR